MKEKSDENKRQSSDCHDEIDEKPHKIMRSKDVDDVSEASVLTSKECLICSEIETEGGEVIFLPEHACGQCSKGVWNICETCHDALLSRKCPVCRGEYAPRLLYVMPGIHLIDQLREERKYSR